MARQRIISPEYWLDAELAQCDYVVRLFYIGSWNFCDDYGVVEDNLLKLRAQIFPYDLSIDILPIKDRLVALKKFIPFEAEGKKWLFIKNFPKYQRVEKPSKWQNPQPPKDIVGEELGSSRGGVSQKRREEKRREEKEYTPDFEEFWVEYPKKVDKREAYKEWDKIKPDNLLKEKIIKAVKLWRETKDWKEKDGKFIVYAERFLKRQKWEDEVIDCRSWVDKEFAKK